MSAMGGQILLVENMAVGNHCHALVTRCRNLGLNASQGRRNPACLQHHVCDMSTETQEPVL